MAFFVMSVNLYVHEISISQNALQFSSAGVKPNLILTQYLYKKYCTLLTRTPGTVVLTSCISKLPP